MDFWKTSEEYNTGGRLLEESLLTRIQNTSARAESSSKRIANIQWIANLPRDELAFQNRTKQLLITKTAKDEEVFIQYPGKESARIDDRCRPWDFFPRIRKESEFGAGLDFKAIWDILFEGLQPLTGKNTVWGAILATIFYRMAFMNDHVIAGQSVQTKIREVSYNYAGSESVLNETIEQIGPWYRYSPSKDIVDSITGIVPLWGGMSFEAFLHYNDLLAWNEDCKYYYRMQQTKPGTWIRETGRVNTLLTHLSIIGYVLGEVRFSEVCVKFARGKGVAPANREEILRVCGGYVVKE